jgi:Protein of unknown function (DUF790)
MLKLADLRKTTRRASDDRRAVYPRYLRDRALAPRIELALRYMESMLGRPRRDLDAEMVVQLFGDHKLAGCIVGCLAATYRHCARTVGEMLAPDRVASLAERHLLTPSDLRLWMYRRANEALPGFVGGHERAPFVRAAADELELTSEQLEELLVLDAPANAILVRTGPLPTVDDVIARFNYETVSALLANASLVRLSLASAPIDLTAMRALCEQAGVRADMTRRELVLHGRQDARSGWARQGARVVRLCTALLACGLPMRTGEAIVESPAGGQWLFRLDAEALAYLGARPSADRKADFTTAALLAAWQRTDALMASFAALRRAGGAEGWSLRRASEPVIAAGDIIPAICVATRGVRRVALVPEPATAAGMTRMAQLSQRLPLVTWNASDAIGGRAQADPDESLTCVFRFVDREDLGGLPALCARAADAVALRADESRLNALWEQVRSTGALTEARVAEWLGCREEDVPERLAQPAVQTSRDQNGIQYVEGFGLCSSEVLRRAHQAARDVELLRGDQPTGGAWTMRVLGRRLREVTGAIAGIECLIAYLGAA